MDDEDQPIEASAMETRLSRLGVTAPNQYRASEQVDWIYNHTLVIGDPRD